MPQTQPSEKPRRKRWGLIDWILLAIAVVCVVLILQRTVFKRQPALREGTPPPVVVRKPPPPASYPDVDASSAWLAEHRGERGLVVADARSRSAYVEGHIPGAISIPAGELHAAASLRSALAGEGGGERSASAVLGLSSTGNMESYATRGEEALAETDLGRTFARMGISDSSRIVCYGQESYSADAARLFFLLALAGADSARILDGGVSGWVANGGLLEKAESHRPEAAWTGEPRPERLATHEYVMQRFGHPGVEVIDARGEEFWEGARQARGEERRGARSSGAGAVGSWPGHIPHSLPFDFHSFLEGGRDFLSPEKTREIFAQLGPRPTNPVDLGSEFIVYGDGGSGEGALGYFLLRRAGLDRVRYYEGGWAEWSGDPSSPVVKIVGAKEVTARLKAEGDRCLKKDLPPERFVLLDARGTYDYKLGHIPGAVSLPASVFADSLDAVLDANWPGVDRARVPAVVYCYDAGCIRSRNGSTTAAQRGFLHVERFRGGVGEWKGSGGKMKRAKE